METTHQENLAVSKSDSLLSTTRTTKFPRMGSSRFVLIWKKNYRLYSTSMLTSYKPANLVSENILPKIPRASMQPQLQNHKGKSLECNVIQPPQSLTISAMLQWKFPIFCHLPLSLRPLFNNLPKSDLFAKKGPARQSSSK
uniref:Uncharacterized protein n=1 Tax=Cucumis melo TaxID=3656 RepID=A0A9I9E9H5_CUCME